MIGAGNSYKVFFRLVFVFAAAGLCWSFCACGSDSDGDWEAVIVVNSLSDIADPPAGEVTLRKAIADVPSGGRIEFAPSLDGTTILLSRIGEEHSILKAEAYEGFATFLGYLERDYGKSALYTRKNLTIDASDLPNGITIAWDGGTENPARVLAVYGNLTMNHVTLTGGYSKYEALSGDQPYTLARGGGLATWGKAVLNNCIIHGNRIQGDPDPSRDRGAMGGGVYANLLIMNDCIVSGNRAKGLGAAGGGVYTVGGEGMPEKNSIIRRSSICGNRVTSQYSYGGGVFTEGGGRGNSDWLKLINSTIAGNLVEDNPDIPEIGEYYYRGGGVYMTNGSVAISACTITNNVVTGHPAIFHGKPNMSGGAFAATIGDAHVVEYMEIRHSIIAGNVVDGVIDDLYTGSLLHFTSFGYNLIDDIDFAEILVPIPRWWSLSRKHYPKQGDADGVDASAVLDFGNAEKHPRIVSAGVSAGDSVVLWYPPAGDAVDRIPSDHYEIGWPLEQYEVLPGHDDDFLCLVIENLKTDFGMGPTFGDGLTCENVTWQGTDESWPSDPANEDWIKFWRDLDVELGDSLGTVKLGDNFWGDFDQGPLGSNLYLHKREITENVLLADQDQLGAARPRNGKGDIGAIEK